MLTDKELDNSERESLCPFGMCDGSGEIEEQIEPDNYISRKCICRLDD